MDLMNMCVDVKLDFIFRVTFYNTRKTVYLCDLLWMQHSQDSHSGAS